MKKRLFLILSVSIMLIAGCGNKNNAVADMETEVTETVTDTEEQDMAGNTEMPAEEQTESGETEKGQTGEKEMPERKEEDAGAEETPEPQSVSQPEQKEAAEPAQSSTDVPKQEETKPEEPKPECEAKPEETKPEETKPQEQPEEPAVTAVSYDPASVCSRAVAKCQAGGMITTTDNLANLLAEGTITQEEYNSYYPYDGLGYYSVFVETDLSRASTTSGRKLDSEDGIADYIAGMMLLETDPVFYIEYAGVYNLNGTDFYEFRCYR